MSKRHLRARQHNIVPYVGVIVGILVLASPAIVNLVESLRAEHSVSRATTVVESVDAATKEELLSQAHAYNEQLATDKTNDDVWPYGLQLSYDETDVIGWVEIPRIDVELCVYRGTSSAALMAGAGHLEGTSLPVGGASTHCVITGHSGVPAARMFDDIHDLVPGDVFFLKTLGDTYAYRVTGSEVVLPEDVSSLEIREGEDLCTLVTCTPYGVNSHRLLVHGERCDYEEADGQRPVAYVSPRFLPLVVGLVVAGGALAITSWLVIRAHRRNKARR